MHPLTLFLVTLVKVASYITNKEKKKAKMSPREVQERIMKDWQQVQENPIDAIHVFPTNDLFVYVTTGISFVLLIIIDGMLLYHCPHIITSTESDFILHSSFQVNILLRYYNG